MSNVSNINKMVQRRDYLKYGSDRIDKAKYSSSLLHRMSLDGETPLALADLRRAAWRPGRLAAPIPNLRYLFAV